MSCTRTILVPHYLRVAQHGIYIKLLLCRQLHRQKLCDVNGWTQFVKLKRQGTCGKRPRSTDSRWHEHSLLFPLDETTESWAHDPCLLMDDDWQWWWWWCRWCRMLISREDGRWREGFELRWVEMSWGNVWCWNKQRSAAKVRQQSTFPTAAHLSRRARPARSKLVFIWKGKRQLLS